MKPHALVRLALAAAAWGAARGQVQNISDCLQTNWFNVCDFDLHECFISQLFCEPYGSLSGVLSTAPFKPSKNEKWIIYVDTYQRSKSHNYLACMDSTAVNSAFYGACKANLTEVPPSQVDQIWKSGAVVVSHSYLTIQALQANRVFSIEKTIPSQYGGGALCRCIEFTGDHIHLQDMQCDITPCIAGFQKSYQYNGDDGVMVAFSGGYAGSSIVENCNFIAKTSAGQFQDYEFRGFSTGVLFGSDDANGQYVDNVFLNRNNFTGIDFAYAFWDVANQFPGESVVIVTTDDACKQFSQPANPKCIVTFKQAYADAPALFWSAATVNSTKGLYPAKVGLEDWSLVNLSAVLPPSFAYLRREVIQPGFQDEVSHENTAVIVGGVLFLLGAIVLFVVIESCYHRRHDVDAGYDEARKQE
jgi:hypothetical protein